ncbi:MAG: sigma-70 family RNA polymerase sigma factor [Oscillospiraceae bacterium]|nr:sigma-70 family RNA polymerase sigma factor [Oscillospiraceae bacterium]
MDNGASSYRRYLKGDEEAFREIVKLYFDSLVLFIYGYVKDMEAAEDISIDVFSQLVIHKHRFHFRNSLKTYLFMMGRSRALDHIKHRDKIKFTELGEELPVRDPGPDPEELLLQEEAKQTLHRALAQLPEEQRQALYLVYFQDLSCDEVGKVLKKNRKQVYNLLYHGKQTLRTILEKEEMDYEDL